MRKFRMIQVMVVCLVLSLVTLGFAGDGVDKKNKVIKLAGFDAVTGKYGNYGAGDKIGQQAAIDQINKAGGIQAGPLKGYKLSLDFFDDRGDAREAASIAKKISSGDYLAVLGPTMSSSALAATPVFNRYHIGTVITYANASTITKQGFNNIARLPFTTKNISDNIGRVLAEDLGKKRVSVIYENQDYGQQLNDALLEAAKKYGFEVVSQDVITAGQDVDFSSVLARAKDKNPDILALLVTYNEGGMIVKQARDRDWTIPMIAPDALTDPKFFELAGDVKDIYLVMNEDVDQSTPQAKYLNSEWSRIMNQPVAPLAAVFGYDAVQVAKTIIENGATNRAEFIEGIRSVQASGGIYSKVYRFDEFGDALEFSFKTVTAEDYKKTLQ